MKKINIIVIVAIISIINIILTANVMASGFSPSSLIFNQTAGVESCQQVTITSDSAQITVQDLWAENKDVEWKVSLFNTSSPELGLTLNYPSTLSLNDRQFNVCLSGSVAGEYHGVLLVKEGQVGNSIIQMGIWIKATISDQSGQTTPIVTSTGGGNQATTQESEIPEPLNTEETENITQQNAITGNVIGSSKDSMWIIALILAVMIVTAVIVYKIKRRIRWEKYGY